MKHKYHAQPTFVDGRRFDSKAEARRYGELKLLEKAGEITKLVLQPKYVVRGPQGPLTTPKGRQLIYRGDFKYFDARQNAIVEDVKGYDTEVSRIKRQLVEQSYGVRITIIK
jgi:hypothetical protein